MGAKRSGSHLHGSGVFADAVALAYGQKAHGFDGPDLLDLYIRQFLATAQGTGIDPGGGAGWLSIVAAKLGARMFCSDLKPAMVKQAKAAVAAAGLRKMVQVRKADARALPYESEIADFGLLSNLCCALDTDGVLLAISELYRVLKPGAMAMVTAPSSLTKVFTVKGNPAGIIRAFESDLAKVKKESEISGVMARHNRIHRATVRWDGHRAVLIQGQLMMQGEPIWRLISGPMGVPNFYQSTRHYERAFDRAGLVIVERIAKRLTPEERARFNRGKPLEATLGKMYETAAAFTLFIVQKPGDCA